VSYLHHEVENFLTEDDLEIVDNNILSNNFHWYYSQDSTSSLFPFLSHVIYARNEHNESHDTKSVSNSPLSYWVKPLVNRYCETYLGRPLEKIYRSCLNLSQGWNMPYPHMEPHIDHQFDHYNLIVYLNDVESGGETLLFDKYFCDDMNTCYDVNQYNEVSILERIKPQKGKAVCFDGRIFHTMNNFTSNQRRVILVTTFR
jgi:hypothetical protein